jgi:hypothetical protein
MISPGDQVINAPFSIPLSRKVYIINGVVYDTEEVGLKVEFMNSTPNQALGFVRSVLDPWIEQTKARIKSINVSNQSKQSPPKPESASPLVPTRQDLQREQGQTQTTIQTCNRCHAPLKMKDGKIDWAKGEQMGQFFPKNPDGSIHRCSK